MRRLPLCFLLILFGVPFAFADSTTTASRSIMNSEAASSQSTTNTARVANSGTVSRAQATRSTPVTSTQSVNDVAEGSTRDTSDRSIVNRTAVQTTSAAATSGDVSRASTRNATGTTAVSRGNSTTVNIDGAIRSGTASGQTSTATSTRESLSSNVSTVGRNAKIEEANVNNNSVSRRAGVTLRPATISVAEKETNAARYSNNAENKAEEARSVQARAATTATTESISEAKERLELTSDLNASCQQQYNDCMDQFCAVIDSNQGRCSCSANLSNYARVEEAVTDANNQLNEVAQRIRYVGLSADEIRAIMTETEAEEALAGERDTSETRNMLDEIEALIRDPSSSTSSTYSSSSFGLDMDLDFSSSTADLFSLDFLNTGTTSFSNLRGKDLYNAAKSRCNTVLTQCKAAGANTDQITGNYDLAIDKDCIAYEQGLTKMNETLVSNVRSANLMLQKARLAVLQNKNQYDAKGCIAALDTCMTDEMVCGADYTKCLDPTKKYIDENGDVVLGEDITNITAFMENYNNASITDKFLGEAAKMTISDSSCSAETGQTSGADGSGVGNNGACIVKYLLQKIGTGQEVTDGGLCRAVLDKCQAYTYDDSGNYKSYNDIVVNYVQRAMVNIKAEQQQIISDYASNCMLDIATCYNQQVTQVNAWSSSASINSVYNVMRGACRNVALTCAYAVFNQDTASCPITNGDRTDSDNTKCINSISEMFYQSLLCPDNSTYVAPTDDETSGTTIPEGYVNERCKCNTGYEPLGTQCVRTCTDENAMLNAYGSCVCKSGYNMVDGVCVENTTSSGS